jgi:hypothetical protein
VAEGETMRDVLERAGKPELVVLVQPVKRCGLGSRMILGKR